MANVTEGLSTIAGAGRRHYIWLAVLVLVGIALAVRYHKSIAAFLASVLPDSVLSALNIVKVAAPVFALLSLFAAGAADAATCCAVKAAVASSSTWGGHVLTILGGLLGTAAFGIVAFPAPDVIEAKLGNGSKSQTFTPTTSAQQFDFFVDGSTNVTPQTANQPQRPLCALGQVIELSTSIDQLSTGTASITDDDMARCIANVTMSGDPLGTIAESTAFTGPILKHLIEFVGFGFANGADAQVASLTVPGSSHTTTALTRYFTVPHAQQFLANPIVSALWLGIVNQLKISVTVAASTALGAVSTGATTLGTNTLRVCTTVVPNDKWHWPILSSWVLENPLGGSTSMTLRRFGEAGAAGSEPVDYVHTIAYLSNHIGLGGNQALDNIASINSPKLGLSSVQNIPQMLKARIEAQRFGASPILISDDLNYVQGQTATGMNLAGAKLLMVKQPGLGMLMDNMLPAGKGYELPIDLTYAGATPSTAHAVAIGSMRFLSPNIAGRLQSLPNSRMPANPRDYVKA